MAKEQKQENPPPVPEVPEVVGPPKSYRLYISLGFVSLILFQVIIVLLIMPPKHEMPKAGIGPGGGLPFDTVPDHRTILRKEPTVERQIGEKNTFKIRTMRPNDMNDAFSVVMHVIIRQADIKAFEKRYAECTMQVIAAATDELSGSSTEERAEATRTAIRERVKKVINEVLGNTWVQEVLFTEPVHEVT